MTIEVTGCHGFERGDWAICEFGVFTGKKCFVWKVTKDTVHVRYENGAFQVFHVKPTHHTQTHVNYLKQSPITIKLKSDEKQENGN